MGFRSFRAQDSFLSVMGCAEDQGLGFTNGAWLKYNLGSLHPHQMGKKRCPSASESRSHSMRPKLATSNPIKACTYGLKLIVAELNL